MKPRKEIQPDTLCQVKNSSRPERNGLIVTAVEYLGYILLGGVLTHPRMKSAFNAARDDHYWIVQCERVISDIDENHPLYFCGEYFLYPITPPAAEIEKLRLEAIEQAIEDERNEKRRLEKLAEPETTK